MASMDIINHYGGSPSNFLDMSGGATHEMIIESMKLLESDPEVKVIFINFFGGILPCDKVATSIISASSEIETTKPIVLRIKGNNSEVAKKLF